LGPTALWVTSYALPSVFQKRRPFGVGGALALALPPAPVPAASNAPIEARRIKKPRALMSSLLVVVDCGHSLPSL
jgi:hypothetical protein